MNWLTKRRKEVGIETQADLEARLQVAGFSITRAAISHWENGRNNPPLDDARFRHALARILRVSPRELLRLAGYEVEDRYTTDGERAAYIVDQLSPDQRELALRLLEQFLSKT